jgi:hypothetical protein
VRSAFFSLPAFTVPFLAQGFASANPETRRIEVARTSDQTLELACGKQAKRDAFAEAEE